MVTTEDKKMTELKDYIASVKDRGRTESFLIAVLHKAQEIFGFLSQEVMDEVAHEMKIPTAHIWGVATFYHYFNLKAPGKHVISVCIGTACYVKGAGKVLEAAKKELGIEEGEVTEDGIFSLQPARCLGACGLAPVVMIDDKIYGNLTGKKMIELIKQYRKNTKSK